MIPAQILPSSKEEIEVQFQNYKEAIISGLIDLPEMAKRLKMLANFSDAILKDPEVEQIFLKEILKYGKSHEINGCKFEIAEVGVSYDYSLCDDIELFELTNQLEYIQTKIKDRQSFLRSIKPENEVYNDQGVRLFAPVKSSKTKVKITLK